MTDDTPLQQTDTEPVNGRLMWMQTRRDDQGQLHTLLILEHHLGRLRIWCSPATTMPPSLEHWSAYRVDGHWCTGRSGPLYAARTVTGLDTLTNAAALIPMSACPLPEELAALTRLVEAIQTPALKAFLNQLLSEPAIAGPFVAIPASRQHHHAYPGGLLAHSVDCARLAGQMLTDRPQAETELAWVAALLHDIGKIRTLAGDGRRTPLGFTVDHDALTLEILAPGLSGLEQAWPEGAIALRTLLQGRANWRGQAPRYPVCEAVRAADRLSAAQDAADQAFAGTADWRNLSDPLGGDRYWRLVSAA